MICNQSVAITGHQPFLLGGYGDAAAAKLCAFAQTWLRDHRPREVISGLAAGWDTAVAEAALLEGIPLVVALAFEAQADHWPAEAKRNHDRLVEQAQHAFVYSKEKSHGCYARRDRWVLDRGDVVLALWSGVEGGTARAVSHAQKLDMPVINLWEDWTQF